MSWTFDNSKPIYIQIADRIQSQILSGMLKEGDKIPSVRELAITAAVNPNTIQKAFKELESRSLVTVLRTNGRQVVFDSEKIQSIKNKTAAEAANKFIDDMKNLGFSTSEIVKMITDITNKSH